jgi:hypothetical protein
MFGFFKRPAAPAPVVQIIDGLTPEHSAIAIAALEHRVKAIDDEINEQARLLRHALERENRHRAAARSAFDERKDAEEKIADLQLQRVAIEESIKGTKR